MAVNIKFWAARIVLVLVAVSWVSSSLSLAQQEEEDLNLVGVANFKLHSGVDAGSWKGGYMTFIGEIRAHVEKKCSVAHGIRVLPTKQQANLLLPADRYFTVTLENINGGGKVEVGVQLRDLYVVGYSVGTRSYFFQEEFDAAKGILFKDTAQEQLKYNGDYNSLERKAGGAGRDKIDLGNYALSVNIQNLAHLKDKDYTTQAKAFTAIIQMVSEAVRFQPIETEVSKAGAKDFKPTGNMMDLENKWGKLSTGVRNADAGGNFSPSVEIGNKSFNNVKEVAKFLKIAASNTTSTVVVGPQHLAS